MNVGHRYHLKHVTIPARSTEVEVLERGEDEHGRPFVRVCRANTGRNVRMLEAGILANYIITPLDETSGVPDVQASDDELVLTPDSLVLTPVSGSRSEQVAHWTIRLARVLGADARRDVRIESTLLAQLQGRQHAHVVRDLKERFQPDSRGVSNSGDPQITPSTYEVPGTSPQPCLLVSIDAAIWLLSERGRTDQALIVRDAVRQLVGEYGRGEQTEATQAGAEARGESIDPQRLAEVIGGSLAALGAQLAPVVGRVDGIQRRVDDMEAQVAEVIDLEWHRPHEPHPDWWSYRRIRRAGFGARLSRTQLAGAFERAGIPGRTTWTRYPGAGSQTHTTWHRRDVEAYFAPRFEGVRP